MDMMIKWTSCVGVYRYNSVIVHVIEPLICCCSKLFCNSQVLLIISLFSEFIFILRFNSQETAPVSDKYVVLFIFYLVGKLWATNYHPTKFCFENQTEEKYITGVLFYITSDCDRFHC